MIEGSPADISGLKAGDYIIRAGDTEIKSTSDVFSYNEAHAEDEAVYVVSRAKSATDKDDREELTISAKLNSSDAEYLLGIRIHEDSLPTTRATWSAPIVAAVNTVQLTGETFRGLGTMVASLGSGIVKQFSADDNVRSQGAS